MSKLTTESWLKIVLGILFIVLYLTKELTFFECSLLMFLHLHYENTKVTIKNNFKENK